MPDQAIEQIATEIQGAQEEVAAAEEQIASGEPAEVTAAEERLRSLEDRLAGLESTFTELRQAVEGRAPADHSHPLPGDVQSLAEILAEMEAEEQSPKRVHPLYRPMFGGD